jgi:hypothetical protein
VLSTKWVLLLISPLLIASSVIRPTTRITEPNKVEQHILVQEEIYRHLSSLKGYQDSTFIQWGFTSFDTSLIKIINLKVRYQSSDYAVIVSPEGACDYPIYCTDFTDSSFSVNNQGDNPSGLGFSWIAVGVRK